MKNIEKIKLYILSLSVLFLLVMVMSVKAPTYQFASCSSEPCSIMFWLEDILKAIWHTYLLNWLPVLMFFCFIVSLVIKYRFDYMLEGGGESTIRIRKIKSEDYEQLTFLATYIIPFFGFTFEDERRLVAYLILLVIIGVIFIRTDKYYVNPTLALLGYKLYRADLSDHNGLYESVIVLSKDVLGPEETIKYKLISDNVFYAKKA